MDMQHFLFLVLHSLLGDSGLLFASNLEHLLIILNDGLVLRCSSNFVLQLLLLFGFLFQFCEH